LLKAPDSVAFKALIITLRQIFKVFQETVSGPQNWKSGS